MKTLSFGSVGPEVQLLQLALRRASFGPLATDGIFGPATYSALTAFQRSRGLEPDGVAGPRTHASLEPWYTGFAVHRLRAGDSIYRLSLSYGSSVAAIETANPGLDPFNLPVGGAVTVPLGFPVVPTDISWFSGLVEFCCRGIAARYPFVSLGEMGRSVMGKSLHTLTLGSGESRVFASAAHHANEWITVPLLMKYVEELSFALAFGRTINGVSASALMERCTFCAAPCVDPDGMDLVTGELTDGSFYSRAIEIAGDYPDIPFPGGWKANILGTDLNLQYPAGWENARDIKFAQGFTSPAPRDFVGEGPLTAPEALSVYDFTLRFAPALTLAFHTQGEVIFWKYLDLEPPRSRAIAALLGEASGYTVEETPYASGFAGYKDWFILRFNRPGYTVEAGLGENPLPLADFGGIYRDCSALISAALGAAPL